MSSIQESENWNNITRIEKLGEILVRFHVIKLTQLTQLIEEQEKNTSFHLGDLAVRKGYISKDELVKYIEIQVKEGKVVDKALKDLGMMTNEEKWQRLSQYERLGEVLLKRRALKLSTLTLAMEEQKKHPEKHLGQVLVETGAITKKDLDDALEWQKTQSSTVNTTIEEVKNTNRITEKDEEDPIGIF